MARRRRAIEPDPNSLGWEIGANARQRRWRECCQSIDAHRFDCRAVDPEKRGKGPFGPVAPPTTAEMIAALRTRIVVDEPKPGVMRVREVVES